MPFILWPLVIYSQPITGEGIHGAAVPNSITVTNTMDTTSFVGLFESATGNLGPKTSTGLTYNATTGVLTATGFSGPLTGTASTVTVVDSTDETSFVAIFDSATGSLPVKTDAGLTYNASTGILTATGFAGPLTGAVTGNADTATLASTVTVVDGTDATSFVAIFDSATGSLAIKTDAGITYAADTGILTTLGLSSGAGGFSVDADGDVIGKSFTSTKVSGAAGINLLYEANLTDTNGVGWKGPASRASDLYLQFSDADPAINQFMLFPAPTTGTSTAVWTTYGQFGALDIATTGSIGLTGSRVLKGWFTDLQVTNGIAGSVTGSAATLTGTLANVAASTSANLATCLSDEQGTGVVVFSDSPTLVDDVNIGAAGVKLTGANGALTILGLGDGADEDVKIDLNTTANTIIVSSPASLATTVSLSALNLVTTGTIQGGIVIDSDADGKDAAAMTTAGLRGTLFIATGAGTWILPVPVGGESICLMDSGTAHDLILDTTAGSTIRLKGTEQADGIGITNAAGSTTGDFICVVAVAAGKWSTMGIGGDWLSQ